MTDMFASRYAIPNRLAYLLFCMLLVLYSYSLADQEIKVFIFIACCFVALLIIANRTGDPLLTRMLVISFLLRFILSIIQAYTAINIPGAGEDSLSFEKYGWEYVQVWQTGVNNFSVDAAYYYYSALIGAVYYIFGRITLIAQLINVIFGTILVYVVYRVTLHLSDSIRASRIAAICTALFPTLVFLSAILLREIIIILFLFISFYLLLLWLQRGSLYLFVFSILSLTVVSLLHGALIVLLVVHLFMLTFFKPVKMEFRITLKQVLISLIIITIFVFIFEDIIIYQMPSNLFDLFSLEFLQSSLMTRKPGRTHYLEGLIPGSYFDLFWHTPIRASYFLFAPFPWMVTTFSDIYFLTDAIMYLILVYYGLKGIFRLLKWRKIETICLLIFLGIIITIYSWGTVNYGTAWRHRAKAVPLLIVLASTGFASNRKCKLLLPSDEPVKHTKES